MSIQFEHPLWLWAGLLFLPISLWIFLYIRSRSRVRLGRFAAKNMIPELTISVSRRKIWIRNGLIMAGVFCLFLTASRPQWGATMQESEAASIDLMFALDTSKSMLAEDITPNRLERSKLAILDLLETVRGDRVGLIAFAGRAFLQCPLTLDFDAFSNTLSQMDTDIIPVGGTDIAAAISEARAYFSGTDAIRILILITDGEDLEASGIAAAVQAKEEGILIYTVGVGSEEGELIPITKSNGSRDYLRDPSGNLIKSSLDTETLRRIATATGGEYSPLGPLGEGLEAVYEHSQSKIPERERREIIKRIPIERFQIPLLIALIFLALEPLIPTRKSRLNNLNRVISLGLGLLLLTNSNTLEAASRGDAEKALKEERFSEAADIYYDLLEAHPDDAKLSHNLGIAEYRAGNYESAIEAFLNALKSSAPELQQDAFYNMANAHVARALTIWDESPELAEDHLNAALSNYQNALGLGESDDIQQNISALELLISTNSFSLTLTPVPEDGGTLQGSGSYFRKIQAQIVAEANEGWRFSQWVGEEHEIEEPEKPRTSIRLEADTSLIGEFIKTWDLSVSSENPNMGEAGESGKVDHASPYEIEAKAKDYFAFSRWETTDEVIEIEDPKAAKTNVTLSGDAAVKAIFESAFKLTINLDPEIGGQAGPSGFFAEYSTVPIQAQPREGFEWIEWQGEGLLDPTLMETTITLTEDREIRAKMKRIWSFIAIPTPEEGGTVTGSGDFPVGSSVPIKAEPADGFTFAGWEGDSISDPTSPETTAIVTSKETTVFARFEQDDSDQENDQSEDSEDQENDQDNQNDQNDSDSENQDSDSDEQEPQDQENQENDSQDQEESESEDKSDEAQNPEQEQNEAESDMNNQVPNQLSREAATQLLNRLKESEKMLPVDESQLEAPVEATQGRDW